MPKYIERDAFIEWLKKIPMVDLSDGRGLCRVIMEDDFKKAIKKMPKGIIADVEPVQEWIPVDERLPECEGSYIVYTERGSIYASHFYTEKRFASGYVREAQWSQRGTVKVTHWMPLPLAPEDMK